MKRASTLLLCLLPIFSISANFTFPIEEDSGLAIARPGNVLEFPRDHGSHPEFKTEWWYITGHLQTADNELGFQITFFRSASKESPQDDSQQIYLAHAAIIDKQTGTFLHEERLNSDDWNASAQTGSLDLYNGNWYLTMEDPDTEQMQTRFSIKGVGSLELTLTPAKDKTLFGENGYSQKGDEKGAASHYITFTRLDVKGYLKQKDQKEQLTGIAWMDHEFSSSQLSSDQIGWNWSSLILDDGSELMAYVMRRQDGKTDPNSRLTLISPTGETTEYKGNSFAWTPIRTWTSLQTGASYPVEYEITWDNQRMHVRPFADKQELVGTIGDFEYWEGACEVLDENGNRIGLAYTELTGYTESLNGKF